MNKQMPKDIRIGGGEPISINETKRLNAMSLEEFAKEVRSLGYSGYERIVDMHARVKHTVEWWEWYYAGGKNQTLFMGDE